MSLKAGIVGLPNVGKSTLFNAITKQNILAANYPFATIEPNVGVVVVKDKRLDRLTEIYNPKNGWGNYNCLLSFVEDLSKCLNSLDLNDSKYFIESSV